MTEQTGTHFLTDIEIKEFKCFTDFKASGFKRVNLIGGKNNVGKTAFMEAAYINVYSVDVDSMINAIYDIKFRRENFDLKPCYNDLNILGETKTYIANSNTGNKEFFFTVNGNNEKYTFKINEFIENINRSQLDCFLTGEEVTGESQRPYTVRKINNIHFINSVVEWNEELLIDDYKFIEEKKKGNEIIKFVNEFDDSINHIKCDNHEILCKSNGQYRNITEFGDGLKHYISIICALYACENGYLFIDEIDNGIYYEHLDRLWEIILTLSKQTNCQVFATTHSKEMLESFARVSKKLAKEDISHQDISYTLLVKDKQQEIKTISFDYEMLDYSISQEHEVR